MTDEQEKSLFRFFVLLWVLIAAAIVVWTTGCQAPPVLPQLDAKVINPSGKIVDPRDVH